MRRNLRRRRASAQPVDSPRAENDPPLHTVRRALTQALKYAVAWGVVPVLLVVLFELGLRAHGYGHLLKPFLERQFDGQTVYVRNREYFEQFIAWGLPPENWQRSEFEVAAQKPDKTYRLFVFGESAPEGSPEPMFSFSRYLTAMLRACYPGVNFEVYNGAFRAVNSHVMRPEALECARFQPDAYVVYIGNNEVTGPFGLSTTSRWAPTTLSLESIDARIRLNELCVVQFMKHLRGHRRTGFPVAPPPMIVRPDDSRLPKVLANHRHNLHAICEAGLDAGARVFLCTVGVNLRNWRSSHSFHLRELSKEEQSRWDALFDDGRVVQDQDRLQEAAAKYEAAAQIDNTYAELRFRLGECYWGLADYDRARGHFECALELDSFEYVRSKKPINDTIREVAAELGPRGVCLVDAQRAIAENSDHGCPGLDLFWDFCHFNTRGAYTLAAAVFQQLAPTLPDWIQRQAQGTPAPLPYEECLRRVGLRPLMLYDSYYQEREHFAFGSGARREAETFVNGLKEESKDLFNQLCAAHSEAIAFHEPDYLLLTQYLTEIKDRGDVEPQLELARRLAAEFTFRRASHRILGMVLAKAGKIDEACAEFEKAITYYPDDGCAYDEWAKLLAQQNKSDEAVRVLRAAQAHEMMQEAYRNREAVIFEALGQTRKAEKAYTRAIWANPLFPDAYMKLDALYLKYHDPQYRVNAWREIADDLDKLSLPYIRLAQALADIDDLEGAAAAYRKAAEDNPSDRSVPVELELVMQKIEARKATPTPSK